MFDVVVGALCLVLASPLMLLIAVLIRLGSPGPVLFRQTRLGEGGRPFEMYKFRTMLAGCSDAIHREYVAQLLLDDVPPAADMFKLTADPRVTRIGAFLRRTSLDELPQLINVVRGEMSLVGPRPMLPWERDLIPEPLRTRFVVPAGMTGLWQVSGRSRLTPRQALDLDVEYVRRQSFTLDLLIVVKTAWILLVPRGGAR